MLSSRINLVNNNIRSYTQQKHLHLKDDWKDEIHDIAQFPKFHKYKILIVHTGTAELTLRYHVREQLKLSTTNFDQGVRLIRDIEDEGNNCFVQNKIRHESFNHRNLYISFILFLYII